MAHCFPQRRSSDLIVDKGSDKGALLYSTRKISDAATGTLLASVTQVSFLRGDGGCGGPSLPPRAPHQVPSSAADERAELATRPEQALIYRLSGDYNPLHADPAVPAAAGLDRPLLPGLCTYGIARRPPQIGRTSCRESGGQYW